MRDFERIEQLQKHDDRMFQAMLNARKTLRDMGKEQQNHFFTTASIAIGQILIEYIKLEKEEQR